MKLTTNSVTPELAKKLASLSSSIVNFNDMLSDSVEIDEEPPIEQPKAVSVKKYGEWQATPQSGVSMADCIGNPDAARMDSVEVVVLSLNIPGDLARYNEILRRHFAPNENLFVMEEQRQWSTVVDNWKIFLRVASFLFRNL